MTKFKQKQGKPIITEVSVSPGEW